MSRRFLLAIVVCSLLLASASAQLPTFRSQSNVVLVPTLVRNADGDAVYGLKANDFVIEDDGIAQTVHLDQDIDPDREPVSMVIAIQRGRSAAHEFQRMSTLATMLDPILAAGLVKIAVVTFDSRVQLLQDFSRDPDQIAEELHYLRAGDGGAAILDAVTYSVNLLDRQARDRQRVLLLISETRDHGSRGASIDDVVTAIGNSNTVVYTLAFSPALSNILDTWRGKTEPNASPDLIAPILLAREAMRKNTAKAIASMTGGQYELFKSRKSFENRMNDFANHLHSRYLLSFEPKNPKPGLHEIVVRLRNPQKDETVLARTSYWAAASASIPVSPPKGAVN